MIESFWFPVRLSLIVATIATIATFVLAVFLSYQLNKKRFLGKTVMETLFVLPLVLPPSVLGFLLLIIFGMNSPIGRGIENIFGQSIMFTQFAAVLAAAVVAFPLMYQSAKAGFSSVDLDIEAAARVDGASEWMVFTKINIPLAWRSLMTGVILSFTRALGEFGATLMFAGNIPGKTQTISTAIYIALESGDMELAWKYVFISIGLSFLFLIVINRVNRN